MLCNRCNTEVSGIHDGNMLWCENCGAGMKHEPEYVTGYCQSHSCRTQVYCRVKRFGKYISRVTRDPSVLQHYDKLLDLYSCFEFAWTRNKENSSRIYFFAKPVLLKLCTELLKLKTQNLPTLKDKLRELNQIQELMGLKETVHWKSMHHIKSTGCQIGFQKTRFDAVRP